VTDETGRRGIRIRVAVLLLVLLAWGATDVRKRARFDPAKPERHMTDVTVYTGAGAAFFQEGVDPYLVSSPRGWHYLYPPLFGILVAPLAELPESEQGFVFYLISLLLLYGSLVETSRLLSLVLPNVRRGALSIFDRSIPRWIVWPAILSVALPLMNCLQRGQVAPFIVYPLLLGLRILIEYPTATGRLAGGIVLALPVAIKLTPLLPVAFVGWVLWTSVFAGGGTEVKRRGLSGALGITSGVALGLVIWILLVPAAFVGWRANLHHLHSWVDRVAANESVYEENDFFGASLKNQSFQNGARLFLGTFRDEPGWDAVEAPGNRFRSELNAAVRAPAVDRTLKGLRVGMILVLLVGGIRLARSASPIDLCAALGLGAVGSVVFSPLSWGHHYGIIWPAALFVPLLYWLRGRENPARRLAYALAGLVTANYAFTWPVAAMGLLGIGIAVWFVVAIVALPRGGPPAME